MNWRKTKRRLIIVCRCFSAKKLINLFINLYEAKRKRVFLYSMPRAVNMETSNYCNLRCPACPTHTQNSRRPKGHIKYDEYITIIDKVEKYIFMVALGGNGELFLIPKIFDYIFYASKYKLFTSCDTNFNLPFNFNLENLIECNLHSMNISIDGICQESYSKYKLNGNYDRLMNDLRELIQLKKRKKVFFPFIQWQFIINKFNESEIEAAKTLAKRIDIDALRFDLPFIPGGDHYFFEDNLELVAGISNEFIPINKQYQIKDRTKLLACYQAFSELQVLYNGDVIPCCRLREKNVVMGNIIRQPLNAIWNNPKFQYFRQQLKIQGRIPSCRTCLSNMIKYDTG